ncbi:MAG: ABC transporter ATP-binding protein [Alphaproteobacteria bacterium]
MIVNQAIAGKGIPADILGVHLEQIPYLFMLSSVFLLLVLVNGGFKYWINVLKGRLGEQMLRRLRYELYARVLRFPPTYFRRVSSGEIIPMITSEVEPLGGFIGDAVAQPLFQGGTLITIAAFMLIQDPILGLAAMSLYPIQFYFIPKLQRKVKLLGKERVRVVRKVADRLSETVAGVTEVHAHDTSHLELTDFTTRLGSIYQIRFHIYQLKFLIKFLNNFLAQLTPFFFYAIGGYLVIKGELSFGALVAVLAAYKDMAAPWKELLNFYQERVDAEMKYEQVVEQFHPEGMLDPALQLVDTPDIGPEPGPLRGELSVAGLSLIEDGSVRVLDGITFRMPLDQHVAIVGATGSGKDALALLLARLQVPSAGRISIGGHDLASLPESVTGRRIAYVGSTSYVFSARVRDNLLYALKHRPLREATYDEAGRQQREAERQGAKVSGNITHDPNADWIDYQAAGTDPDNLTAALVEFLRAVEFEEDIYQIGLRSPIDIGLHPELAELVLTARRSLCERVQTPEIAGLIEPLDAVRFNSNASVAENLLFGTPVGPTFAIDGLASHPYLRQVLDRAGLTNDLVEVGRKVAETMVEIFAGLPPTHEFFERYSFISSDDLPEFQLLLGRVARQTAGEMRADDREKLLALPFKLVPARHRLGVFDEALETRLLEARRIFRRDLPPDLRGAIEFFDPERYNAASSIQDNILFGKIAYGQAEGASRVGQLIATVVTTLGLRNAIVEAGLDYEVGVGGARLSAAQRQKITLARALLKRPDLTIVNEALVTLDAASQSRLLRVVKKLCEGRGLIWILHRASLAQEFHRVLVMKDGRIVEDGTFADLNKEGGILRALIATE